MHVYHLYIYFLYCLVFASKCTNKTDVDKHTQSICCYHSCLKKH